MGKAEAEVAVREPLEVGRRKQVRGADFEVVRRVVRDVRDEPVPLGHERLGVRALGRPLVRLLQDHARQLDAQLLLRGHEEPVGEPLGVEVVRVLDVGPPAVDLPPEAPRHELLRGLEEVAGGRGRGVRVVLQREQVLRRLPGLLDERPVVRKVDLEDAEVEEVVLDRRHGQEPLVERLPGHLLLARRDLAGPHVARVDLVDPRGVAVAGGAEPEDRVDLAEVVPVGLGAAVGDGARDAHRVASAGWRSSSGVGWDGAPGSGGVSPARSARTAPPATNRPSTRTP